MFVLGLMVGLGALTLGLSLRSYIHVEEGEIVVLTRFGRALRSPEGPLRILRAGLHRKRPWDVALRVNVKEQSLDLSGDEHRFAMTSDGVVVRCDSTLRFAPIEAEVEHYLFTLERPMEHLAGTFSCLLRNEIANFGAGDGPVPTGSGALNAGALIEASLGAYAAIRRERGQLQERLAAFCRTTMGARLGLRFDAIDVMNFEPPDELRDTLHTVIQAKTDAESSHFRAQGECQQRVLAARRGVEIASLRAQAVETEMLVLGRSLEVLERTKVLPLYVARRQAEVLSESRHVYVRGTTARGAAVRGGV